MIKIIIRSLKLWSFFNNYFGRHLYDKIKKKKMDFIKNVTGRKLDEIFQK